MTSPQHAQRGGTRASAVVARGHSQHVRMCQLSVPGKKKLRGNKLEYCCVRFRKETTVMLCSFCTGVGGASAQLGPEDPSEMPPASPSSGTAAAHDPSHKCPCRAQHCTHSVASLDKSKKLLNFEELTCTNHPEHSHSPRAAAVLAQPMAPAATAGALVRALGHLWHSQQAETRGEERHLLNPWGGMVGLQREGEEQLGLSRALGAPAQAPWHRTQPAEHGDAPWHGSSSQGKGN